MISISHIEHICYCISTHIASHVCGVLPCLFLNADLLYTGKTLPSIVDWGGGLHLKDWSNRLSFLVDFPKRFYVLLDLILERVVLRVLPGLW